MKMLSALRERAGAEGGGKKRRSSFRSIPLLTIHQPEPRHRLVVVKICIIGWMMKSSCGSLCE